MKDCPTCNQPPLSPCCGGIVVKGFCGDCKEHADEVVFHICNECGNDISKDICESGSGLCPDCVRLLK